MGTKKRTDAPRKRNAWFLGASAAALVVAPSTSYAAELIGNGNFETGNFVGWTSTESNGALGGCDTRWTVGGSVASTGCSVNNRNPAAPIGSFAAYSSFDGNGPQTFSLRQTIAITGSMSNATLSWSDSFGADYSGLARTMTINIVGTTTTTVYTYVLPYDLPTATGWTSHTLDITSALNNYVGQNVQLEFLLTIPEDATGPAGAGLDNVSLDVTAGPFDGTPPTLDIDGPAGTQTAPFQVNFNFSEDVNGFDASDVALTNASISGFTGSGSTYAATITPTGDGLVSLNVAAGAYEDTFGNDNTTPSSFSVQADVSLPTATVAGPAGPVNAPFVATFTFSEDVNNFALGDIGVVNGVASGFSGAGSSYSATITPTTDGAVNVSLAAGVANDAATNGNQASNIFSVVADLTAPIITTPGNINVGTDAGLDTAVVAYSVTANDPGNGALTPTLVSGPVSGSAFPIGTTTISYSATDTAGNVANASFDITVADDEDPVIVGLPADINVNTDAGQATAVVSWSAPTVTDNAAGATITQTAGPAPGSAFPIGTTTVTYEAEDASGNIVTGSFDVTVTDNEGPSIVSLPADINVGTDAGQPTAVVSWVAPTVTDNAPGATITQTAGLVPGSAFPVGTTTITYEAEDAAGNITIASFDVTVTDNENPVIVGLPADISVSTDAGQATAVVNWSAPTVTDNAPGASITQTAGPAPGSALPIGVTTITYEAEDASGNTVSASFTITVEDDEAPSIVSLPADINVNTDAGQATAVVMWTPPSVSDNAPGATITQTAGLAPGAAFPVGAATITYEAEDAAGNISTASFTVTVADNEPPAIVGLPANINVSTDAGQATAVVNWSTPTVSDNAPGATITQTAGPAPGSAIPIGVTTVTYEAEDASGNTVTASFTITVDDNEGPSIVSLPADISVNTDAGQPTAVVNWTPPSVTDNAPGATIMQTAGPAPGAAFPIGATTITYEAEDASGNIATASFNITVQDAEPPAIVGLPADIAQPTDAGLSTAVVNWTAPTVTDNAPGATITQTAGLAPGSAFPIGVTTITYQAQDAAGNIVTASFNVSIEDDEPPAIVGLPADISVDTDAGQPTAVVNWTPPTVSDNAPSATITQTAGPAPGSAFPIGTTTITYEAEDAAGNVVTASFTVSVADDEAPSIVSLPADIVQPTDAGLATAVVNWAEPTANDNAPGATITRAAGPAPGSTFPIGVTTITYEAEDASGNVVSASFTVTIEDGEAPAIVGLPADIVTNTDAGLSTAVVTWTPPTANDNAPSATITQTAGLAPGSAFPIGATTITYEAEDAAGNTTTASFIVTVEDNELPVIAGMPADMAVNTDAGLPTAVVSWTAPTVSDNAPGATITQTAGPAPGSAFPVGVTTITYQALDVAGNTVTQSFNVTVSDAEPPAFVGFPANITIVVDYPATSAIANWTAPTVSDNALGATITQIAGPASGSTFALGATTITYRAEDDAGNVVDQSFTVTVTQTAPGSVRLVVQSGKDGSFAFSSVEPDLNLTIETVGGDGEEVVTIRPGVFNLAFALPAGFGVLSADCSDNNSDLSADSQTGQINISSNEQITCTIVTVDSLTETSRLIGAFMGARANLITQNMPDSDRRIDRLNGQAPAPGGVSAFGMNIGRGETPFDLSIGQDRADFSFSLAGLRAQHEQNRRDARDARARWGDGQFDQERTISRGHDFSSFGAAGPSDDPYALASGFGAGSTRAPDAQRGGEGYPGATNSESARLPDSGPQAIDVWVEGTYAQFDTNVGDGDFYMMSAGIDYVNDHNMLFGFAAQVDWTDMSGPVAGSSMSGQGYLVGPYLTARLADGLYFDGHIAIGRSKNEVSPFGVYEDEVDAERTYLSGALIGDIRNGPWTLRPEGRVTFFREEMDSYVDGIGVTIPSIEVSTGEFEFSPTVRYRYELDDESVFTPFASVEGIWTFESSNTAAFALGSDAFIDNGVRGRVEAGFDFVRPSGMRFSGAGFYDGVGEDDFSSWGAQLRVSWSFEPE